MHRHTRQRGFTLLELSIVLLVIGVLLGSVMVGQYFLRTSQLRSSMTQVEEYIRAISTFKTKYEFLPGDLPNATTLWGEGVMCRTTAIPDADPGACNGNGNEFIDWHAENFRAWQHMSNAGIIKGAYLGHHSAGLLVPGVTNPGLDIETGMVSVFYFGVQIGYGVNTAAGNHTYPGTYNHVMLLGGRSPHVCCNMVSIGPVMTTEEAWHIDSKMDDQRPGTGIITTFLPTSPFMQNCATTASEQTAIYKIGSPGYQCSLIIKTGY